MATYVGIGFSKNVDAVKASLEAAEQAKANLKHDRIDLALVLCTPHYTPSEFLPSLFDHLHKTKLIGSSTAGIILSDRIEHKGIAILVIYSEDIRFETGFVDHLQLQDLQNAGKDLGNCSVSDFGKGQRKLFFFFADGLLQEFSPLLAGLKESFNDNFPILGAGSSDNFQFKKTHQIYNNTVLHSGAAGILFGGRVEIASSCRHGWRPVGKPRAVTNTEANVAKHIDNKPAAHIYQEYFDTESETLKASNINYLNMRYPLGMPQGPGREYLLRNIIKTLEDDSIVFQDTIPTGKMMHLMIGNKDSCLQAAELAAEEVRSQLKNRLPKMILIFESLTRSRILGRSALAEIKRIHHILGDTVPLLGMYSFGEVTTATYKNENQTLLQNGSILIIGIY